MEAEQLERCAWRTDFAAAARYLGNIPEPTRLKARDALVRTLEAIEQLDKAIEVAHESV